jgi:UDP-glucose 4-epimerase
VSKGHVLVSGGNGLLGRATIQRLSASYRVTALVRKIPKNPCLGVNYLEVDLSRDWDISDLPDQCDLIIHVAQSNNYKDFPNSALEVFNVNLTSTLKLLEYGRQAEIQRFVLASTGGLYEQNRLPLNEDSALFSPDKLTHYLATKLSAEIFSRNFRPYFHVDMLRIFFMYGPEQKLNMLVPRLIKSVLENHPIQLAGNDGIRLNPIFVEDVVSIIETRMQSENSEVVNVAGQEVVTIKELAEVIGSIASMEPKFEIVKPQLDFVSESILSSKLLSREPTSLRVGLEQTVSWFRGHVSSQ